MPKNRIEAFSDGVIAIIITIMVLEISAPAGAGMKSLLSIVPGLLSYLLSFLFVGVYWNNHHHLFQTLEKINAAILWTNLILLFLLSMFPVATAWMEQTGFSSLPIRVYAIVNLLTTLCYLGLEKLIVSSTDCQDLNRALSNHRKEISTIVLEVISIALTFVPAMHWLALLFLVLIIPYWIVPDLRIAAIFNQNSEK